MGAGDKQTQGQKIAVVEWQVAQLITGDDGADRRGNSVQRNRRSLNGSELGRGRLLAAGGRDWGRRRVLVLPVVADVYHHTCCHANTIPQGWVIARESVIVMGGNVIHLRQSN